MAYPEDTSRFGDAEPATPGRSQPGSLLQRVVVRRLATFPHTSPERQRRDRILTNTLDFPSRNLGAEEPRV